MLVTTSLRVNHTFAPPSGRYGAYPTALLSRGRWGPRGCLVGAGRETRVRTWTAPLAPGQAFFRPHFRPEDPASSAPRRASSAIPAASSSGCARRLAEQGRPRSRTSRPRDRTARKDRRNRRGHARRRARQSARPRARLASPRADRARWTSGSPPRIAPAGAGTASRSAMVSSAAAQLVGHRVGRLQSIAVERVVHRHDFVSHSKSVVRRAAEPSSAPSETATPIWPCHAASARRRS